MHPKCFCFFVLYLGFTHQHRFFPNNFVSTFFRFFSLLFVYLIAGMIFMKFVKKAEGKEVIPNSSFWFAIPGHIKVSGSSTSRKIEPIENSF